MIKLCWIIISLILITNASNYEECWEGDGCSCGSNMNRDPLIKCSYSNGTEWSIVWKSHEYVEIECRGGLRLTREHLKRKLNKGFDTVKHLKIIKCYLSEELTLSEIVERLNLTVTASVRFEFAFDRSNGTLTREQFKKFPNIISLNLMNNQLEQLPQDLFADLPNLQTINLRGNNVKLPVGIFKTTKLLRVLELSNNHLKSLEPKVFEDVENLRLLNVWQNDLTIIPEGSFDKLKLLQTLDLHSNKLTELSKTVFTRLGNLKNLSLMGNHFASLPEGLLSNNHQLEKFQLSYNQNKQFITLPRGLFKNLTHLRTIELKHNGLTELPNDILHDTISIIDINLSKNKLRRLPENIFKDSINLKILDLQDNQLESLPERLFFNTTKLNVLKLSKNRIVEISRESLVGLDSLKELYMSDNGLTTIHFMSFTFAKNVQILDFQRNNLTLSTNLHDDFGEISPFHPCSSLETLILSKNIINGIFSDWTLTFTRLRKLDLKYNNISRLSDTDLQFVSNTIDVDLTHNKINHIILDGVEALSLDQIFKRDVIIQIDNNPILCDCELYHFLQYLEGNLHPYVQNRFHIKFQQLTCESPKWFEKVPIQNLKSKTLKCMIETETIEKCSRWFRPENSTYIIDCSYKNLTSMPNSMKIIGMPDDSFGQIEINLIGNALTTMHRMDLFNLSQEFIIRLSNNSIIDVPLNSFPRSLKILELDHNKIERLDSNVLEYLQNSTTLVNLTLHGNPWKCDCNSKALLQFVQKKFVAIPNLREMTCLNGNASITSMSMSEFCPSETDLIIGVCLAVAIFSTLIGIVFALYYRYQTEIKVWLYAHQLCLWFVTENELDKNKSYDAFISYSHKDEEFVVNELVSKLESGPRPYKLCLHYRDWLAGEYIPTQIAKSVEESRRTIVVISPDFLESVWGRMEFRAAHSQALSEGRARVIVILYGEIGPIENLDTELKAYLKMNTYVKWGDPWFWDKLHYALPHSPKLEKSMMKKNICRESKYLGSSEVKLVKELNVPPIYSLNHC